MGQPNQEEADPHENNQQKNGQWGPQQNVEISIHGANCFAV
jgi:hypothetical protein